MIQDASQAQEPGKAFDRFVSFNLYDSLHRGFTADVDFYRRFMGKNGISSPSNILEIGCGTGRVLEPLLSDGYQVTGVDISEGSLALARQKLPEYLEQGKLRLVNHNIINTPLPDQYSLALITYYTFSYIPPDSRDAFIEHIFKNTALGGVVIFDLNNFFSMKTPEKRIKHGQGEEFILPNGRKVIPIHDREMLTDGITEHAVDTFVAVDTGEELAKVDRTRYYTPPAELKRLLESHGFEKTQRVRNYDGEPSEDFEPHLEDDDSFLIIARKPQSNIIS